MQRLDAAIFSFIKYQPKSTVASQRITEFIKETLSLPVYDGPSIKDIQAKRLIIVNGAFAFCDFLPELAKAILHARDIIWVQNDYTIIPPKFDGFAESPFRKAFVLREEYGQSRLRYWTTCESNLKGNPLSRGINWNSLTYIPEIDKYNDRKDGLFYYGAYRKGREAYFDRYFTGSNYPVRTSSSSRKFNKYESATVDVMPSEREREDFFHLLEIWALGLYIEDKKSHVSYHSPANRFYEMLSKGQAMVFQPESYKMLMKAGIDISDYEINTLHKESSIRLFAKNHREIAICQHRSWARPYRKMLKERLLSIWKETLKEG